MRVSLKWIGTAVLGNGKDRHGFESKWQSVERHSCEMERRVSARAKEEQSTALY